jgi:hypothetical protein
MALPLLVPHVGDLDWDDVARIRRMKPIDQLRGILREVETEAFDIAQSGGDLEAATHRTFYRKVAEASKNVEGIRSLASTAVVELFVGASAGTALLGLSALGPLAGAGVTATVMTGWHARRIVRERSQRAWIGVMDTIVESAP